MEEELIAIKNDASTLIIEVEDFDELERIKLLFLGKSGRLSSFIKNITKIPIDRRPEIGRLANEIKETIEFLIEQKTQELQGKKREEKRKEIIDVTLPGRKVAIGHLHPQTQALYRIIEIFRHLGYEIADGPEIDTDFYNFEILNIPQEHPARDTQQTLYLDTRGTKITPGEVILRTHTSGMQGRIMEKIKPPLRVLVPGKVFRYEQVDASHSFEFWQVEGFVVDKNITLTDLLNTLTYFLKKLFGKQTLVNFAGHYFPFTEPSIEAYVSCIVCGGRGCSFCKQQGFVELLGAGMIHPNVFKAVKIDPKIWQGFAFGMGLSRIVTLKYQMDDLRLLTNPDLRILEQF